MSKFELVETENKNIYVVTIIADKNDGDYLTTINKYYPTQFSDELVDELIDLKQILGSNHALLDYVEKGYANIPFDTETGENCHTLEELTVEYIDENGKLWNVKF